MQVRNLAGAVKTEVITPGEIKKSWLSVERSIIDAHDRSLKTGILGLMLKVHDLPADMWVFNKSIFDFNRKRVGPALIETSGLSKRVGIFVPRVARVA